MTPHTPIGKQEERDRAEAEAYSKKKWPSIPCLDSLSNVESYRSRARRDYLAGLKAERERMRPLVEALEWFAEMEKISTIEDKYGHKYCPSDFRATKALAHLRDAEEKP